MATKEQIREKTIELINQLPEWLPERLESLLQSGAIDFPSETDSYHLPKLIMCALGREIEWQYYPSTKKEQKKISNLRAMI